MPDKTTALGLSRVLIVTDERVAATGIPQRAAESMQNSGLKPAIFTGVPFGAAWERIAATKVPFPLVSSELSVFGRAWVAWFTWAYVASEG